MFARRAKKESSYAEKPVLTRGRTVRVIDPVKHVRESESENDDDQSIIETAAIENNKWKIVKVSNEWSAGEDDPTRYRVLNYELWPVSLVDLSHEQLFSHYGLDSDEEWSSKSSEERINALR